MSLYFGVLPSELALMLRYSRLSAYTDARNAMARLTPVWKAETFASYQTSDSSIMHIDPSSSYAIEVKHASFQWEEPAPPAERNSKKRKHRHRGHKEKAKDAKTEPSTPATQEPFAIRDISLSIPKKGNDGQGQVWAVVGPVGSGKSSLLQALIGEMRQIGGDTPVMFGGKVAYCAQVAWIQNASLVGPASFTIPLAGELTRCISETTWCSETIGMKNDTGKPFATPRSSWILRFCLTAI